MANAKLLRPFILRWEGGFVNDPADHGGATNKGIAIGTFRSFYGQDATVEQLRNITDEQWLKIFRSGFRNPCKADRIGNQSAADLIVDRAWASGPKTAIRPLQRLLGLKDDGIAGPDTLGAINRAHPRELFERIRTARLAFVDAIVQRDQTQGRFMNGWKNRIHAIEFSER